MSRSLRSIKDPIERKKVIERRLLEKNEEKKGNGYWAAFDAKRKIEGQHGT